MKLHANACNVFFKRGHKKCRVKFCFCWVITLSTIIQEWLLYTTRKWRRKVYLPVPWYVINTLQSFQMDIEFIKISLSGKKKKEYYDIQKSCKPSFQNSKLKRQETTIIMILSTYCNYSEKYMHVIWQCTYFSRSRVPPKALKSINSQM